MESSVLTLVTLIVGATAAFGCGGMAVAGILMRREGGRSLDRNASDTTDYLSDRVMSAVVRVLHYGPYTGFVLLAALSGVKLIGHSTTSPLLQETPVLQSATIILGGLFLIGSLALVALTISGGRRVERNISLAKVGRLHHRH